MADFSLLEPKLVPENEETEAAPGEACLGEFTPSTAFITFLCLALGYGICATAVESMLAVFVATLTEDTSIIGWCLAVQCLSELPLFYCSDKIMALTRPSVILLVAAVVLVIRLLLISMVTDAMWLVPLQVLHGASFVLFTVAGVEVSRQNAASPASQATMQGVFQFMYSSLGGVVGSSLGGFLFDAYGPRQMYLFKAGLALLVTTMWATFLYSNQNSTAQLEKEGQSENKTFDTLGDCSQEGKPLLTEA